MTDTRDGGEGIRPGWFFAFFLISGFCGLVYQVVWLRLAMAAFGVTAPMVSIVISVFMAGLALGSWLGGRLGQARSPSPLRIYAWAELAIATSGVLVPFALSRGREVLVGASEGPVWGSLGHHLVSGALVTVVLLPFCTCMGATFPLALGAIRRSARARSSRSFSYLYVANVVGACAGTLLSSLVLIELMGFRGTLGVAALLNAGLAALALALDSRTAPTAPDPAVQVETAGAGPGFERRRVVLFALFATGFASMGMEVVWVRQLTPYLGTVVYAFAFILALYLAATFAGSILYRRWGQRAVSSPVVTWSLAWSGMGLLGLLSLASTDPRLGGGAGFAVGAVRAAVAIVPLCAALGFFTPMILDRWSGGEPGKAGTAYAVNMLGCILGPLASGFLLLPVVGERGAIVALAVPLLVVGLAGSPVPARPRARAFPAAVTALSIVLVVSTRSYEHIFPQREVRRDYTATVIATGEGMGRQLLVNGVGMTKLTPITKLMAHLPLVHVEGTPRSGLAVCLGMGVTFRSLHSWGLDTTAVELVPSVPSLFTFYHPGEEALLHSPRAHIAIDDGRRFLERSHRRYDVITIDPPPPITTAGASLLYSREMCALARSRLRPGGVLQHWLPGGDPTIATAVTRALTETFPHVRAFSSIEGWGIHFLASDRPLPRLSPAAAARRLPAAARADLLEWGPAATAEEQLDLVLRRELSVEGLLQLDPRARALSDDHPVNEYYLLRSTLRSRRGGPAAPR
jgi:spermidine synthase